MTEYDIKFLAEFEDWLELLDFKEQAAVTARVANARLGNLGDHKHIDGHMGDAHPQRWRLESLLRESRETDNSCVFRWDKAGSKGGYKKGTEIVGRVFSEF